MNKSNYLVITGVSTGIGLELTRQFIAKGYHVFGSVRKVEDAERLQAALGDSFTALLFDVTDYPAIEKAVAVVEEKVGEQGLAGLINNAGIAVGGPALHVDIKDFEYQFQVNVFGLIRCTQLFAPLLGARENHQTLPGRIINIGSVSGKLGMPFVSPYVGSKFAVEGLSDSLRRELLIYGIDVILIGPGPIKTPIWKKSMDPMLDKFRNSVYHPIMKKSQEKFMEPSIERALSSEKVARIIHREFERAKSPARRVNVGQRFKNWTIPNLLPARVLDKVLGKVLGLSR